MHILVAIILIAIVVATTFIFGLMQYVGLNKRLNLELDVDMQQTVAILKESVLLPAYNFDEKTIERIIQAEMSNENIQSVFIIEPLTGNISYGFSKRNGKIERDLSKPKKSMFVKSKELRMDGNSLGTIEIYYTDEYVISKLRNSLFRIILEGLLVAVLLIIITITSLSKLFVSPIEKLTNIASEITTGITSKKIKIGGSKELEKLGESIYTMRDSINEKIEKLRKSEHRLSTVLSNLSNVIYYENSSESNFITPNIKTITGYSARKLSTKEGFFESRIFEDDRERAINNQHEIIERDGNFSKNNVFRFKNKDDTITWFEDHMTVVMKEGKKYLTAGIMIDVTDRKKTEELLIQSEKMLSVGGLAAGMAHEINNPLGGMVQNAQLISNRLGNLKLPKNIRIAEEVGSSIDIIKSYMEKRNIFEIVGRIRESGGRAAKIIDNMLSFSRKDKQTPTQQNIPNLIDRCIDLSGVDFSLKKGFDFKHIQIVREYENDLPYVLCKKGNIEQVIINILKNGAEAMFEKKSNSKNINGFKPKFFVRVMLGELKNFVHIEIEDNGSGMSENVKKRIFEPFFTTKPTDSGTGLGLSMSYFIITEDHFGKMYVESEIGKGSKFVIKLPLKAVDKKKEGERK